MVSARRVWIEGMVIELFEFEDTAWVNVIEFVFDSTAPTQTQIEHALRCWRNPQLQGCAVEDVGP